ncbi:sigma 54-interacting transcriptional regulator [uncultured Roseibium sp.]|uniref:sigma-54-dependent Fis family transcriptional regulator n=1 Tax=uncultured Roseibium sp. TaxID=1936171 RepID=UPI002637A940|nr:sigma 54-interacting transcriptional regulator [uncultured Roseibium sp.]
MGELTHRQPFDETIKASWERCERQHGLVRATANPVLRLQASEIAPRLDELIDRSGGRLGVFSELSRLGMDAGHCLVVTDSDGIVVRFESPSATREAFETNGIGLGSCWDERIAGTNGVSVALGAGDAVTVRGTQHYHTSLTAFACTAVPMLDADNKTIGAVSLSAFDRSSPTDYLIAKELLLSAVGRIQSKLFEAKYADYTIVNVTSAGPADLLRREGLVAVDDQGIILSSTIWANELAGLSKDTILCGQQFDGVFGTASDTFKSVPTRVASVGGNQRPGLSYSVRRPGADAKYTPGWQSAFPADNRRVTGHLLSDLICGSHSMAKACARVEAYIKRATPVLIEGESGTGKSALVGIISRGLGLGRQQIVTVDCASIWDSQADRDYVQNIYSQARVVDTFGPEGQGITVLVLDNVGELPAFAQSGLRKLVEEFERDASPLDMQRTKPGLRIVAVSRESLFEAVQEGRFREDLYYLLAGAVVELPPLREREGLRELAQRVGSQIAGADVQIAEEAHEMLAAYDWPGNVRELRNALHQALLEGNGTRISLLDLQPSFRRNSRSTEGRQQTPGSTQALKLPIYDERQMLLDALTGTNWNVSKAARILGIGRATINRKIKQHGLLRPS